MCTVFFLISISSDILGQCTVDAGEITSSSATTLCIDGNIDLVDVMSIGAMGINLGWIITDENEDILDCPSGPPFEFDGAGEGQSRIYRIAFEDDITGKVPGMPLDSIGGCFDLSNSILITRDIPDGGTINSNKGMDVIECAGDILLELLTINDASDLNYRFVLTDENDLIISILFDSIANLSNTPPGECHIWGWSFGVEPLPEFGDPISSLADGDCESVSINFISVTKLDCSPCMANGGIITPRIDSIFCINSVPDLFAADVSGAGDSSLIWVVTDIDSTILAFQDSVPFNLEGLVDDNVYVWHLEFESDFEGLSLGNRLADLSGCFGLSNAIFVARQRPDGGLVSSDQGSILTGCLGSMEVDLFSTSTANIHQYAYFLVNTFDIVALVSFGDSILIDSITSGDYRLYGLSFSSLSPPSKGESLEGVQNRDCQDLSDNFLSIQVLDCGDTCQTFSGVIKTLDNTVICIDANPDFIVTDVQGGQGSNAQWIVTDEDKIIVGLFEDPVFSLNTLGVGTTHIWHIRYEDGISGLITTNSLLDLRGCFDLSNSIDVDRVAPDGGTITSDQGVRVSACQGNLDLEISVDGHEELLDYSYIVTSSTDTILAFSSLSSLSLDTINQNCRIYGWSKLNEDAPVIGSNISSLENNGCTSLSNNFIVVEKIDCGESCQVDAGFISTLSSTVLCVVDSLDVSVSNESDEGQSVWVITNTNGQIISLQESTHLNLDSLGTCLVWSVRFIGVLSGLDTLNTFPDFNGCFSISNFIRIDRDEPDGGIISALRGDNIIDCPGFSVVDLSNISTSGFEYLYVVTDTLNEIISFTESNELILRDENHYRIWGWSVNNACDPIIGTALDELNQGSCQEVSINFISVIIQDDRFCITSTNNINRDLSFEIFPNPTESALSVMHPDVNGPGVINIFSILGQHVYTKAFGSQEDTSHLILSGLATGTYLVRITAERKSGIRILIIL